MRGLNQVFDACVIGSGASGAVAAYSLAEAGWQTILIEQGDHVPPGACLIDLIPEFEPAYARDLSGGWSLNGYPWTASVVGGGTMFWAGISFRNRLVDFDARPYVVGEALDPRWPVTYSELAPYYDQIESMLGVSRTTAVDPTEPPSSPSPLPPHPLSRRGLLIKGGAESLGLRPFPTPLAIASRTYGNFPACSHLTPCTDYACPTASKADAVSRFILPILDRANFRLLTRTRAIRLDQERPDRVTSVECFDLVNQTRFRVRAKHFLVAGNAVQTAALLLRSSNRWWPKGIGNANSLVGASLSFKASGYVHGWIPREAVRDSSVDDMLEKERRGPYSTVAITDHYLDAECPTGLGGLIIEANPSDPRDMETASDNDVLLRLECLVGDQPLLRNRVRLANARDKLGLSRIIMDYRPHQIDMARLHYLFQRAERILIKAGASNIKREHLDFTQGSAHLHSTCRSGRDENESVCDPWGRIHLLQNAYILDGAFIPFAAAVNPTLTIQANALRIAQSLIACAT